MAAAHRAPLVRNRVRRHFVALATVLVLATAGAAAAGIASASDHHRAHHASAQPKAVLAAASPWRTQWAISLDHPGVLAGSALTCRMVAHVNQGGSEVRFRLVNYPSKTSVTFTHLVAAIKGRGMSVDPATRREVTVGGKVIVTLVPNGQVITDPVDLPVQRGQDLTLSIAVGVGDSAPGHYWSSQTSGCTAPGAGDQAAAPTAKPFDQPSETRWLSEVQVLPTAAAPTVAVYGDSLSDAAFLPPDSLLRWTDQIEEQTGGRLLVLNYGVIGDRITGRAPPQQLPPRVATDVLAPTGISAVVVEMGSNDIKAGVSAKDILASYGVVGAAVAKAQATLIVATVPARGDNLSAAAEHQRQLLNAALRTFPIVADLDVALTDTATDRLRARYDVGDHIHPNVSGVAVIAGVMRSAMSRVPGAVGLAAR